MHWEYKNKKQPACRQGRKTKNNIDQKNIIDELLEVRGYVTEKEKTFFLNPPKAEDLSLKDFGINQKEVEKGIKRIKEAIDNGEHIIVYGDYDVDGVSGTAILWETLYQLTPNVLPYLPERISEGYGFNLESVKKLKSSAKGGSTSGRKSLKLIITVDQGVTAGDKIAQVKKELGIDVIVCDHHELPDKNIPCEALIHTTHVCAAAVAWVFAREIINTFYPSSEAKLNLAKSRSQFSTSSNNKVGNTLELVALATIADLEPLTGINRSLVKYGLEALNKTKRPGLLSLIKQAGLELKNIGTYEVGYILAPRINAMGRMAHAIEALRLLCTQKETQALELAQVLDKTNRDRQSITEEIFQHSRTLFLSQNQVDRLPKFILVAHESYQEGVIGLAAGKLTEEFHRPSAVISIGEKYSKASARSITGFNIIETLREHLDLLVDVGGHLMAAGFTIETEKIEALRRRLIQSADEKISDAMLEKVLKVDLAITLSLIDINLHRDIQRLAPFGIGNPEPIFSGQGIIKDTRVVGSDGKHLKLTIVDEESGKIYPAIAFNQAKQDKCLNTGTKIDFVYSITLNQWNNNTTVELKLKDIKC